MSESKPDPSKIPPAPPRQPDPNLKGYIERENRPRDDAPGAEDEGFDR